MGARESLKRRTGVVGLVVIHALLVASEAFATPVSWVVSGVFEDDATLNGSFVYDSDTDVYSEVSLKTSAGPRDSPFFGAAYDSVDPVASTADGLTAIAAATRLELIFAESLSDEGGIIAFEFGSETLTSGPDPGSVRLLVSGTVEGTVPEPSSAVLLALGLSGLASLRRSRR